MAIHRHTYVNQWESTHLRCHSCWKKDPPFFIILERFNAIDDEEFDVRLCYQCAMNIGIHLIADAREASREADAHQADAHRPNLSLVTQRPSHDRESVSSETDLDF
jgi:hypothetical protein